MARTYPEIRTLDEAQQAGLLGRVQGILESSLRYVGPLGVIPHMFPSASDFQWSRIFNFVTNASSAAAKYLVTGGRPLRADVPINNNLPQGVLYNVNVTFKYLTLNEATGQQEIVYSQADIPFSGIPMDREIIEAAALDMQEAIAFIGSQDTKYKPITGQYLGIEINAIERRG